MPPIVPSLAEVFAAIPDPRHPRGVRHPLVSLLLLSCVAMLAGARGQLGIADWAKNYTFTLKKGVTFHSGKDLTAADVKYSFERWKGIEKAPNAYTIQPIDTIETPDPQTVVVAARVKARGEQTEHGRR